jgi:class 3 adenylate cyclase
MVDVVTGRNGIVDKYIDDAVMALFGHSVKREDDVPQALAAALDMLDTAGQFNREQKENGRPAFETSMGISYGVVTVGNIGCEQKMGYTVIGDQVNLASRAQGMCKIYRQSIIFTEPAHGKLERMENDPRTPDAMKRVVRDMKPYRMIDKVAVKGKEKGVRLYTVGRNLTGKQKQAWDMHNSAMEQYLSQSFSGAAGLFDQVQKLLPGDFVSEMMAGRCRSYERQPPPPGWEGVEVMKTK